MIFMLRIDEIIPEEDWQSSRKADSTFGETSHPASILVGVPFTLERYFSLKMESMMWPSANNADVYGKGYIIDTQT